MIEASARASLARVLNAIHTHPGTGQARRLVAFLAGCYSGEDYPFDLSDLRCLDLELSDACLDVLSFDRLGALEIHQLIPGGDAALRQLIDSYGIRERPQT